VEVAIASANGTRRATAKPLSKGRDVSSCAHVATLLSCMLLQRSNVLALLRLLCAIAFVNDVFMCAKVLQALVA
jgi:hypothetical protein